MHFLSLEADDVCGQTHMEAVASMSSMLFTFFSSLNFCESLCSRQILWSTQASKIPAAKNSTRYAFYQFNLLISGQSVNLTKLLSQEGTHLCPQIRFNYCCNCVCPLEAHQVLNKKSAMGCSDCCGGPSSSNVRRVSGPSCEALDDCYWMCYSCCYSRSTSSSR